MTTPTPTPDTLVRDLKREVELMAKGRDDLLPFVSWLRTRLDVLAERVTPSHTSHGSGAKRRRADADLN